MCPQSTRQQVSKRLPCYSPNCKNLCADLSTPLPVVISCVNGPGFNEHSLTPSPGTARRASVPDSLFWRVVGFAGEKGASWIFVT